MRLAHNLQMIPRLKRLSVALFSSLALLSAISASTASVCRASNEADERVPFTGVPRREWLVTVDEATAQLVAAKLIKSPTELALRASIPGDGARTLIAGVVVFEDGSVASSPLRPLAYSGIDLRSSGVAQSRLTDLRNESERARGRVKALEREMERVSAEKRIEAGLHEVDEVYQRLATLEEKIKGLRESANVK